MPRPALTFVQRDFSAGQVTENAARSDDVKLVRKGLKEALNIRLASPRGYAPRHGRDVVYTDEGRTETFRFGVDMQFRVTFGDGSIRIRDYGTGDIVFEADGYPWDFDSLSEIVACNLDREIIVCFRNTRPWVINYRAAVATQISYGAGTLIGNYQYRERAFLGLTSQTAANSAQRDSFFATGHIGKSFSTPRRIGKAEVHGSSNFGYGSSGTNVTLTLYAKQGAAPANETDGTVLATTTFAQADNTANPKTLTSSDTATEWDHVWIRSSINITIGGYIANIAFFTPSGAEAWASDPFEFAQNAVDVKRQPYYKFTQSDVTMMPANTTGAGITVEFSAPVLVAGHVGVSFRYCGRELVCASVVSPTQGTFDVVETLPPTHNVTVASTAGFRIGEIAIGATTDCQALIVDITSSTVFKAIYIKRFAGFASSEKIVSPSAVTTFSSTTATDEAATAFWDEAAMSDVRGWPASCSQDRSRVMFADLPKIPPAIAWSAIGVYNDMLPGSEATEGMFETAPGSARVRHIIGGADQFALTDKGIFYIPISETNPLVPGSVIFRKIGSIAAGGVVPVEMDQGVVFGAAGGNGVIGILPTGQQAQPWELRDVSRFHAGLISGLKCMAVQAGTDDTAEQYLYCLNADGTAVSGRLDPDNQWIGFVKVECEGLIEWISAFVSEVLFNVAYEPTGGTRRVVETISESRYLDGCVDINAPGTLLAGDPGDGPLWMYAGLTVDLMLGRRYLGRRAVDADGEIVEEIGDDFSTNGIVAGFGYTARTKQYLPNADEGEAKGQRMARRKVKVAVITVRDATEFDWMGRTFASFRANDPGDGDPPLWSTTFKARSLGRSYDPETVFEKTVPGPCTVLEASGEVTV
jgi:hypothetical protein